MMGIGDGIRGNLDAGLRPIAPALVLICYGFRTAGRA
jgi:hypothetical protein